jgi:hypothetical protein
MIAAMLDSRSSITSDRSRHPHPRSNRAIEELLHAAGRRRKESAVLLALTGQLLADTRELLERCGTAMTRARYPGRRRANRAAAAAALSRKPPRGGPRR